ncbi:hypothetical protein AUP43_04495 [Oceanibaculum pacificum]|uniref:M23ase beta-sheet core domain-containing protein n=2 Tax=Oceanibaculum pacificum TaxID=580166 RepID=A0A154WGI6_9PROT|nr:hypothetical protein AUP43_04495 [Oceanibaculum pacificum]
MTMRTSLAAGLAASLFALAAPAWAQDFTARLPIGCTPGKDCWAFQYPDVDPGPNRQDYACGKLAYDGHDGTDIGLASLAEIERGVPVFAAAPGTVKGVRDGMQDALVSEIGKEAVKDRECGNGVLIEHGDGWQTQYCHMRKGSLAVRSGQQIEAGAKLGEVGLSGSTDFPHLEFIVRKDGKTVDPFRGDQGGPDCGIGKKPVWDTMARKALAYGPAPYHIGAAARPPKYADVQKGAFESDTLPGAAEAVVLWAEFNGLAPGDILHMTLTGPDGKVMATKDQPMDAAKVRQFLYIGKKRTLEWQKGEYTGVASVERKNGLGAGKRELRYSFTVE